MKHYYIGHYLSNLKDGGQARNLAFKQYFQKNIPGIIIPEVYSKNFVKRIFLSARIFLLFLFSRQNKIFIHQGTMILLFPLKLISNKSFRKVCFSLLQRTAFKNKVIIEVNDLPFEQMTDLDLPINNNYQYFEEQLYSLKNVQLIFASNHMGEYASAKYKIPSTNFEVIINGGHQLAQNPSFNLSAYQHLLSDKSLKYIYAGSLNKGRQIEELIQLFNNRKELLFLIGEWGDWLKDFQLSKNVHYLGKFDEDTGQYIVSLCDVGLIPYDESRFYYNLCYPTKASFYLTAGIPFLSTPTKELQYVFGNNTQIVFLHPFTEWEHFMNNTNRQRIMESKLCVSNEKHRFYWNHLISECKVINDF